MESQKWVVNITCSLQSEPQQRIGLAWEGYSASCHRGMSIRLLCLHQTLAALSDRVPGTLHRLRPELILRAHKQEETEHR